MVSVIGLDAAKARPSAAATVISLEGVECAVHHGLHGMP